MNIIFTFQGDEVFNISLPNNTKSAQFEMSQECYIFAEITMKLPTIAKIEFFPESTRYEANDG